MEGVKNEELLPKRWLLEYTFMSQMCVNDPHNTMEFWFAFDAETGVSKMSKDIMVQASETKDKIIEFRKKKKGILCDFKTPSELNLA